MRYYDIINKTVITENSIEKIGLTKAGLKSLSIFPIEEIIPEIDGRYQLVEPSPDIIISDDKCVCYWDIKPLPLDFIKAAKLEDIASKRYDVQTSGITFKDTRIFTDRESVSDVSNILQGAIDSDISTIDFKTDNKFIKLTIDDLKEIVKLINVHVQACFTNESRLSELINNATTVEEINEIDLESGWPE